ncbi:MAG TPA: biliverdin-producing heme oxygenase [Ilumatobacter sp.]|nr:biliverdin-producing heme oxygenase [Ilumatobacter sp.]
MHEEAGLQTIPAAFSERLREATAEVHDAAEQSTFMTRLVDGQISVGEYVGLTRQYHAIYAVLEEAAVVMRDDAVAGQFVVPGLERLPSLEADLVALAGPDWASEHAVTPATEAYATRLREVCFDWPGGFVAHHYVRYLGDLSGGQILRRILGRTLGLTTDAGLAFYLFDQIDNGVQLKKRYRTLLDEAPWAPDEQDRIAAEAARGFQLNIATFASLEA